MQAMLVSIAGAFDAQQTFISIFTDAQPTWHCTQPGPGYIETSCSNSLSNICQLPKHSWAWDLPTHTSIVSEWDLECSGSLITGLPASSFFMGCVTGGFILATLADSSLGRKNMLVLFGLVMAICGFLTAFSTNIWVYTFLKFVSGIGRSTIGTSALVLSTETVGKRWRGQVGVTGFFFFTFGFLSLPAMAYLNRGSSWRNLYLWTSIPAIFYCVLIHFFVCESPRWLFVEGRKDEAVSILKRFASANKRSWSCLSSTVSNLSFEQETWNVDVYSAIKILLQKRWAFQRLTVVTIVGFGIGLVYYGMPLGLGNLTFNFYLSVTFNALFELPAALITFFLIGRLNRKLSILVFSILSGICSIICIVLGKYSPSFQIGLELVSFFSACTAFNILLLYTIELFPTCVRNSAVSMVRQAAVLGGAFSPILVAVARNINGFLSYGVFGLVIASCGLFVVGLPETRGGTLSDTMDEEEHKQRLASTLVNDV
ncbi:Sugar_tr domain-containing protein [Cephalotus follicularis]|uniref:Sugar_tr domain-containing protein n=1 Tax=Cephalotus follicularis TaxID=3775 RepID=A0A1Q3BAH3_CEPFO|nr:Sugar_tr domain-containing protein [Cephalotus follicularis]